MVLVVGESCERAMAMDDFIEPVEEEAEMRRSARTRSSPRGEGPPNRIMDDQEEEDDRAENTSSTGIGLGKGGEAIPERGSHRSNIHSYIACMSKKDAEVTVGGIVHMTVV